MQQKAILFDFDGVLCTDKFYQKTLVPEYKDVYDWIQEHIFGNKELVKQWMRGHTTSSDINKLISTNTQINFDLLQTLFTESVRLMNLNEHVLRVAIELKKQNKKIGMVTNNMDIFSSITISNHHLYSIFDTIINSSDYGVLKQDDNGKLFDIALEKLNCDISDSLLIDDSPHAINLYKQKGGETILFSAFDDLKNILH